MAQTIVVSAPAFSCHVLTFKEGFLSSVAHDLKLRVERCRLELRNKDEQETADLSENTFISAFFDPKSVRVVCARRDGRDQPDALSADQKAEIEQRIQKDVLHTDRFPEIRFVSTNIHRRPNGFEVAGELFLHGERKNAKGQIHGRDDAWMCEVSLHQPQFGIRPYSALLGTLRIKPDVIVSASLPRNPKPAT
ncbi:MAG TPA: YceI family protein [Pseudomonadota bacterium]|nr:YceI family protein [Pseudomonadota bacterium]